MARTRLLTEYRVRPILRRGGIVVASRGSFRVYRGPDTRFQMVGWVSPHIIQRLSRDGCLSPMTEFPDRLGWRNGSVPDPVPQPVNSPLDKVNVPGRMQRGLAHAWLASSERVREKAAAGRFQDAFTRASQPMRSDRQSADAVASSAQRLSALESELGTACMRRLEDLIIDRATQSALSVRWAMDASTVRATAGDALTRLARAYELVPAADSPA